MAGQQLEFQTMPREVKVRTSRRVSVPFELVKHFERLLQAQGVPIVFEASLERECRHAKLLLRHCKGSEQEARALIEEFICDEWEVQHNRSLSRVGTLVDKLRARIAEKQQRLKVSTDDILQL